MKTVPQDVPVEPTPDLRYIPVPAIDVPPRPARRELGDIAALAESMRDYGLQQPISVRATDDRYMLTSGLRRLTAARSLGWTQILAFVRTATPDEAYLLDLIENLQRQDLSPDEEADALVELIRTRGWTLQQVADAVKRSVGYVSKRVRVFEDTLLRAAVVQRGLAISTAEELLKARANLRGVLVEQAIREGWDQARARDALRTNTVGDQDLGVQVTPSKRRSREVYATLSPDGAGPSRPPGLTRAVREFHRLIIDLRPEALSAADRSALRALFRDLVMLARASNRATARVFPALPER